MRLLRRTFAVLVPIAVGLSAFVVYLLTLLPSVGWGDIARFQYVARIWGVPHRFGYPLYIALSRLFGFLPLGDLAYRINLMSAVFAALAVVCLIGSGTDRRHWRWLGVAAAGAAFSISAYASFSSSSPMGLANCWWTGRNAFSTS